MTVSAKHLVPTRMALVAIALMASEGIDARGVSPYLPWQLSPEIERRIERLLILADKPVLTRPIAAATVLDALPAACEKDRVLCEQVRGYLQGFMKDYGLAHASLSSSATSNDRVPLANRRGMLTDSSYEASAQVYWQISDKLLISGGMLAYDSESVPTGSLVSFGTERAQIDVGFRDHWFSPMSESSMLIGTQAQTMPSITVSNYTPMTRWGLRYEVFIAEMSESQNILFGSGFTSGNPRLAGVHLSIEPFPGWSLGINRILQFGGGLRSDSFGDFIDAFFRPSEFDNTGAGGNRDQEFGNQAASITARYLHPGSVPFSVYFEYAGEDTSANNNTQLGNVALSGGLHFPTIWNDIDLTIEVSEWQNGWYVNSIYQDGLRHHGNVIGHWGADQRVLNDGVGAQSFMVRLGWEPKFGGLIETTYRSLDNEAYTSPDYKRAYALELRYSRSWQDFFVGGEVDIGRDVFDRSYSRIGAFIRF